MNESNSKKLYVGSLPFKTTEEELHNLFAQYGEVLSARIVVDRANGDASKGFGFVEMKREEDAQNAAKELNEARPEQKTNFARRDDRAGGNRSFGNDRPPFRTRRDRG